MHLEHSGSRHRVCKAFFLKTLCISNRSVMIAVEGKNSSGTFGSVDGRGRQPPSNRTDESHIEAVKQHIRSFPTVESHYCRKDTQRLYLDSKLTVQKMYDLYTEKCRNEFDDSYKPVSPTIYRQVFNEQFNLGFYKPKKDQCAECSKYDLMTAAEKEGYKTEIEQHLKRNKDAQAAKAHDKIRAYTEKSFKSVTFDLQSVLQVPSSDASLMYYKRKLCCYNFTVFEQAQPNDAHCFLWSEVDGKRGSNEIGSCLLQYLQSLPDMVGEVSLFSDTCGGQNRNQNVAAILLYAVNSIDHINVIEQKFLESGHTYMECDSMHSAIEFAKKHTAVFCLSSWKSIFEVARRKHPYKVHQLEHRDFFDCKAISEQLIKNRCKNEDGETVNWLKIKVIRFEKSTYKIQYKYRYADSFSTINTAGRGRPSISLLSNLPTLAQCYKSRLPISAAKKNDLLALCKSGVIPKEHHEFFKRLPSSKKNTDCDDDLD